MPCTTLMPYDKAPWSTHVPGYTTPDTAPCYHPCTMLCYPYIVVSVAYVSACGCADYNGICNTGICNAGACTYTGCCCAGTNCPCHHYAVPVLACYVGCGCYCCGAAKRTSLSGPMPSSPSYTCTSCTLFALSPAIVSRYAWNTFAGTSCTAVRSGMTIPVPSATHYAINDESTSCRSCWSNKVRCSRGTLMRRRVTIVPKSSGALPRPPTRVYVPTSMPAPIKSTPVLCA